MTRDEILALPKWVFAEPPRLMKSSVRSIDPNEPVFVTDDSGDEWEVAEQNSVLKRRIFIRPV